MARFDLVHTDKVSARAGSYKYGPASIWVSGPAGGRWYATVKFRNQEVDLEGRSLQDLLEEATDWVDAAPELRRNPAAMTKAEKFFYDNAGYSYGPGETKEQGRARTAKELAAAEAWATEEGYRYIWEEDPDGWDSLGDVDPDDVTEVLMVAMVDENGEVVQSLGGVLMGHNLRDNQNYGRVVEAWEEMG